MADIRLSTLDIKQILTGSSAGNNPKYPAGNNDGWNNNIVYIYNKSASSSARRGIRLKNGSKIPSDGLTVASNNPVYIQGDYNSGRDYSGNPAPPSNSGNPADATTPQVANYNGTTGRAPCAVVADAVTILSNNWVDSNAQVGDSLSGRVASNTTVNTAIVAGIVASSAVGGDGAYSGGAENFPRFLEVWGAGHTFYLLWFDDRALQKPAINWRMGKAKRL